MSEVMLTKNKSQISVLNNKGLGTYFTGTGTLTTTFTKKSYPVQTWTTHNNSKSSQMKN